MTPKITDEMRRALEQRPGKPLAVEDEQTQKVYVLVPQEDFPVLVEGELHRQLQIGFDQADQGQSEPWNIEATLTEAHRRRAERLLATH
jgi:hypothetical protein